MEEDAEVGRHRGAKTWYSDDEGRRRQRTPATDDRNNSNHMTGRDNKTVSMDTGILSFATRLETWKESIVCASLRVVSNPYA